jgi:hypothetical protein
MNPKSLDCLMLAGLAKNALADKHDFFVKKVPSKRSILTDLPDTPNG